MDIVQASGIDTNRASYRTFVRYVKKLGYAFYNSRKKGVLTDKDFQKRRMFARSNSKKKGLNTGQKISHSTWIEFPLFMRAIRLAM